MNLPPLRDLRLARAVADRSAILRIDAQWLAKAWQSPEARVVQVHDGQVAVRGAALILDEPVDVAPEHRLFLGVHGGLAYFAAVVPPRSGVAFASLRQVGAQLSDLEAGLVVHAVSLANWHGTHTHCPRCGDGTVPEAGGHVRRCVADGSEHYPRTDPAVIMSVVDDADRLLLGRQASWEEGRFSTLAGFVEPGESLEAAVRREVHEEVGVTIGAVTYLGSQPWPFPSSLMLGFRAEATSTQVTRHDGELAEARWFSRAELVAAVESREVLVAPTISIARRLIEHWLGAELQTNLRPPAPP
jgi:NAD+ diphosphatase